MTAAGETFTGRTFVANASSMKVIAALLRDPNPIHFDRAAARAAGRGDRLVGQGPVSAALLYEAVLDHWPGAVVTSASLRYVANAVEDESLAAHVTVTSVEVADGAEVVTTAVRLVDDAGVEKVTGVVVARLDHS